MWKMKTDLGTPPHPRLQQIVQEMVLADRRLTVSNVASTLDAGGSQAHHTYHDLLGYRKVSARLEPRQFTFKRKTAKMAISLWRYECGVNDFLFRIIPGDETWVHHFIV
ncbi:hypothetical protein AVEN_153336-1 [Araneus ventricosus]|uniref:Transposase Tc1-like domain-containing protein n=1 Tax=Araneus ventricosus TaxID=182803 RepID=A0A4Y2MAV0_ARAVE|nr:hypothetical protein AVEN_153336-1 [Araneus ventricosus]